MMQTRHLAFGVAVATAVFIWALFRGAAESGTARIEEASAGWQSSLQKDDSVQKHPGPNSFKVLRESSYRPGEIELQLVDLVAEHQGGTAKSDLTILAHDIYLELLGAGRAAVPEVLEFLAGGQDLFLSGQPESEFDFQSLRLALIDALSQIGGIDVERALSKELVKSTSHAEFEALAAALESLQPYAYREVILDRGLSLLTELKSSINTQFESDSAPLFRVLQVFGDEDINSYLQNMPSWLDDYAEVALANLPGGEGLDTLERLARRDLRRTAESRALHLLTQLAVAQQDAEHALFELALSGSIPDQSWPLIADILIGDRQLQLQEPSTDPFRVGSLRGSNPFAVHSISDRQIQSIYSVNYSAVLSPEDVTRRLALIHRLLDEPIGPVARDALWAASDLLSSHY